MANYNVYIPKHYEDLLKEMADQDESIGQVVKRLVLEILDGDADDSPAPDPEVMDYLNHRLDRLEEIVQLGNPAGPDRLDNLEERLEKLESELKSLALQFSERVYEISQAQAVLTQRVAEIQPRLDSPPAAAVPTPTRLPKATKRKIQDSGETP